MPDSGGTAIVDPGCHTGAANAILERLDRIASDVAELKQPQAERDLLREIARSAGSSAFSVAELLTHAAVDAGLRAAVLAAVGDSEPARAVGQLLRRCAGREVAGVTIQKIGVGDGAAIWRAVVRQLKPSPAVAADASITDDAADIREST